MDDDIDFDDLLGEERAVENMTTKRPIFDASKAPSENELRLGRRVVELEKEREVMIAEIHSLRAKLPISSSPPIPLSPSVADLEPIIVPHSLLPTLNVLRQHISDLTRDNAALRYTFLGEPVAGPSRLPTPLIGARGSSPILPSLDQASISVAEPLQSLGKGVQGEGVDAEKVLQRVKALMLENEELGEMVLEAGKHASVEAEWQTAMDESKAVIESLDSDLSHHLATIQSLRGELQAHRTKSSSSNTTINPPKAPTAPSSHSSASLSIRGSSHRPRTGDKERERPRERIRDIEVSVKRESGHSHTPSMSSGVPGSGTSIRGSAGRGEKHRDNDRDPSKEPPKGPRDDRDVKRRR